jgi:hypothetical protein
VRVFRCLIVISDKRITSMRTLLPPVCILVFPALAATAGGEIVIQGNLYPLNITPTFDHGYLAVYEQGGFAVYAPDGSLALRSASPGGGFTVNVDIDSDGSVAAVVHSHNSRTGDIRLFSPDGSPAGRIATDVYQPSHVCFAPDHSVWVLGSEELLPVRERTNYSLLRHYSRTGALLGEFFPRSSFPEAGDPGQVMVGMWRLRIAGGRIGAALNMGPRKGLLWLETDLTGAETGRWAVPSTAAPMAMTDNGTVYVGGGGLFVLDRASGAWKPVPPSSKDTLLGAEGNSLVFAIRGTNQIRRAAQP